MYKNEILVSFGVCSFSISSKNEKFPEKFSVSWIKLFVKTVIRLFKLTEVLPRFIIGTCLFEDEQETLSFLGYWVSNLGIFRSLKLKLGYF